MLNVRTTSIVAPQVKILYFITPGFVLFCQNESATTTFWARTSSILMFETVQTRHHILNACTDGFAWWIKNQEMFESHNQTLWEIAMILNRCVA